MRTKRKPQPIDRLIQSVSDCLTPESAERLVKLKADPELQAHVSQLADKCSDGTLTEQERAEYASYIAYGSFVDILKSKARQFLVRSRAAR